MIGKLGAIFRGDKQIGGFQDWTQETILTESSNQEGQTIHKFVSWKLTTQSYWLFDSVREVTVRLYPGGREYWEGKGYISSPIKKIYDTLIHEQLEIVGEGVMEGKAIES